MKEQITIELTKNLYKILGGVRFQPKSKLYIHVKVVLIDPEETGQMYIGSCNFWPEALSRNREIGIITNNSSQIQKYSVYFRKTGKVRSLMKRLILIKNFSANSNLICFQCAGEAEEDLHPKEVCFSKFKEECIYLSLSLS